MKSRAIAVPIAAPTLEAALQRVSQTEPLADLIEFRLDYLNDFSPEDPVPMVQRLVEATRLPIILTYHPNQQTEPTEASSFQQRITFWRSLFPIAQPDRTYLDLDLALVESFHSRREPVPWNCVIASYHNFHQTPDKLTEIYERMAATPAAILKIATLAQGISDNIALFALLKRARQDDRRLIVLGMGEAGVMSRILTPVCGGALTFGALNEAERTAPGQPTAAELRHLYRVHELAADTNLAGVIGNPVSHSLSPLMHNRAFAELGLDWVYVPLLVADLEPFVRDFVKPSTRRIEWKLRGLSVTIPHKIGIIPYLDRLDPVAEEVGAVNTLVIEGGQLVGYNTDVEGAMRPLRERMPLKRARAVILGAGGAARAVGYGLVKEGAKVTILARHRDRAKALAHRLGGRSGVMSELVNHEYDLLINATPVGLSESMNERLVSADELSSQAIVFDLIPRVEETRLLRAARAAGCMTINGLEMLVYQAVRQFELWTGQSAPVDLMFEAVGLGRRENKPT